MILDEILKEKARIVAESRERLSFLALKSMAKNAPTPRSLSQALHRPGHITCIAEFKRRSPSKGWIKQNADAIAIAKAYESFGASAISVLTDATFFGGSLDDLRAIRAAVEVPILRKEFILDPYQVVEARAAGADAVLLIASALEDSLLKSLLAEVNRWGMEALVEAHDAIEVRRAVALGVRMIGVNHRDLRTFSMDMDLALRLRPEIPPDRLVVAESGLHTFADVDRMRLGGLDAILVGESLMRAENPGVALQALLQGPSSC
jgi:indole-3-glycerol phosphate synthase